MARRAEHAVSDTLYAGTAKVVGEAGAAEEQTGKVRGCAAGVGGCSGLSYSDANLRCFLGSCRVQQPSRWVLDLHCITACLSVHAICSPSKQAMRKAGERIETAGRETKK